MQVLKSKKGQALVEFVLLLPIIIFVIFIVVDFANVYYKKNHLEGVISDISSLIDNNASDDEITKMIDDKSIKYDISYDEEYAVIKLSQEIDLVTPFSNVVLDNPFPISVERKIIYD